MQSRITERVPVQAIGNALSWSSRMRAVETHQRMLAKVPIECRAIGCRQSLRLAADDPAGALLQVADAQRRKIGRDDAGQLLKDGTDKRRAVRALRGKRLQRVQGGTQIALGKLGKHRGHATVQPSWDALPARIIQ